MRRLPILKFTAFTLFLPLSAHAETTYPRCGANFARLLSDDVFRNHSVKTEHVKPVPPAVRTGRARLYRTVIREQAKLGPDFAGHYTIIRIGCGAGTVCLAVTDARTGKVYFPPEPASVSWSFVDLGKANVERLTYRTSSRLLVAFGFVNEDQSKEGLSYYEWRAGQLRLVRFIPIAKLCKSR